MLAEVGSTNTQLERLAEEGAPEGLALVTDHQFAGRGRLARRWEAPPGGALLTSLLLRPPFLPTQAGALTMLAAVAAAEAVEAVCGPRPALKWPNDLLLGGRKLGGILAASRLRAGRTGVAEGARADAQAGHGRRLDWVVLGIGINVNFRFPPESPLAATATTLLEETGHVADRGALACALYDALDAGYGRLLAGEFQQTWEAWRSALVTLGQTLRWEDAGRVLEGVAEDVTPEGSLLVRLGSGALVTLTTAPTWVR